MSFAAVADKTADLTAVVERLSGRVVHRLVPVLGGRNNRLLRADTDRGPIAVKHYPKDRDDQRDRLSVEYEALSFLVRGGVQAVPRPLARDDDALLAIYQWIEGDRIDQVDAEAIDAAVAVLRDIHRLAPAARAGGWTRAASASIFSPAEALEQISNRRAQFNAVAAHMPPLAAFLAEFDGRCRDIVKTTQVMADRTGIDWDMPLPADHRVLSPSDFGFHNALRRPDGTTVFVDFEYFGWDDPAKLCCDFCMHPGSNLSAGLAARFEAGVQSVYGKDNPLFPARRRIMRLLCGLCWCMIILNEFLPTPWQRRVLAGGVSDPAAALPTQLEKARALLVKIDQFRSTIVEAWA
jgi:hypothetical protein